MPVPETDSHDIADDTLDESANDVAAAAAKLDATAQGDGHASAADGEPVGDAQMADDADARVEGPRTRGVSDAEQDVRSTAATAEAAAGRGGDGEREKTKGNYVTATAASHPAGKDGGRTGSRPAAGRLKEEEAAAAQEETSAGNFVKAVEREALKAKRTLPPPAKAPTKRLRKGIFLSYSPDAGFLERKFVVDLVRQLKDNNLAEDIWLDKDEKVTDSPAWFSLRVEAVERCRAAIVVLSDNYFSCPVSVYEGRTLIERLVADPQSVHVFLVLFSRLEETEIPRQYGHLIPGVVDLTAPAHAKKSIAEKSSVVIGAIMEELERFATMSIPPPPVDTPDAEFTGEFKRKRISQWTAGDLQEWLFKLGIKEFYRQSLAESAVDGFLLMAVTDEDMMRHLSIDSRVVRKKIMQQILQTLDKEYKMPDNWHLRARTQRPRANTVYVVYDPSDVRLAQGLKADLQKKGLTVIHHQKLGQSKDEFLQINGPHMATATHLLVVLTETAASSPFVFHEILFGDWLGKKVLVAMFKNVWPTIRPGLKAVLGDCTSVDFESKLYAESMDVLEHHFKPQRSIPGVVLEQSYLDKMADGLKPLAQLVSAASEVPLAQQQQQLHLHAPGTAAGGGSTGLQLPPLAERLVFISYHWDMQSKVEELRRLLEGAGFVCWADVAPIVTLQRGSSSLSSRSLGSGLGGSGGLAVGGGGSGALAVAPSDDGGRAASRGMRQATAVLCCVTPKYLQSDGCAKDLALAEALRKPLVPVMLRYCPWPPEGAPTAVRKILARCQTPVIELYNDKLFKVNLSTVVERMQKVVASAAATAAASGGGQPLPLSPH